MMRRTFTAFLLALQLILPSSVLAQGSRDNQLSLTLTPPLIQVGIARGYEWKSSIRFVNGNPHPITIYARVVPFSPDGETGNAKFPAITNPQNIQGTLASWIEVPKGAIAVREDSTADIPVRIRIPDDAPPGGHYAAILVGTEPDRLEEGKSGVAVGSMLASLVFVRVPGEVVEAGSIRDFYAVDTFLERPDARFVVRFENTGNVHVLPRGEISIRNMWGKERGKILVNDADGFGNVLPGSTRKFEFEWTGEENAFEFGRYTALATLSFGEDGSKTVYREAVFWVVPWKPILLTLLFIVGFLWFANFAIRRYVRRALELERERLGILPPSGGEARSSAVLTAKTLSRPIIREMADLSHARSARQGDALTSYFAFIRRNALFFLFVLSIILVLSFIGWYFAQVLEEEREYEVRVLRGS